ncbi:hypothetical protein LZ554_002201 [Drepanopeziza brunnea f. sp. 'monogermtubi']|nr:hypothetical protein LZ554_002201 [Drepanopeziza brunnea f. sp. 'monogermtubi']
MQFVTVLSVTALITTAVALQPFASELMKKYPQRHGRWWSWRHHNHHHTHTGSGPSWTQAPVVATSAIADPESLAISVAFSVRSTLSSVYTFPNSTSSASSTAYTMASSSSSYLFPNATANSTRVRPTAYSPSSSFGCSTTTSTSTLTITESITYTLFLPTTSSTNHTWTNTSSSVPYPPFPSLLPTNALTNRTTFTPIPFPGYGSSLPTTLTTLTTTTSFSSLAVEIGTSSGALEALPIPVSADPIFTGSPSAALHPVTTVSQTTTVTGGPGDGRDALSFARVPTTAAASPTPSTATKAPARRGATSSAAAWPMAWTASSRRCRACGTISTVASLR